MQDPKYSPHQEGVSIRQAVKGDIPQLVRLINAAFIVEQFVFDGDRIDAEETQTFIETGKFLIAQDSAGFVGCVYMELRKDRGYLGLLAVDPPRQGTGLGRRLVAAAEDYFRAGGCSAVDLRVISQRTPLPPSTAASATSKSVPLRSLQLCKQKCRATTSLCPKRSNERDIQFLRVKELVALLRSRSKIPVVARNFPAEQHIFHLRSLPNVMDDQRSAAL